MISPAGRPWRVMTISSSAASRRYFEKSSLTLARATALIGRACLVEPGLRLRLFDDREDFDGSRGDVIKHPDVVDPKAILRLTQTPKPLDSTLARFRRFEPEVTLERVPDFTPNASWQPLKPGAGVRGQHDLEAHSGQIIARLAFRRQFVDRSGLTRGEVPRLCRGGRSSLTFAGVSSPSHHLPVTTLTNLFRAQRMMQTMGASK